MELGFVDSIAMLNCAVSHSSRKERPPRYLMYMILHGPDFELKVESKLVIIATIQTQQIRLTNESQDPVHKLMPSLLTPRQLTRLSWPTSDPTFSPLVISQTYSIQSVNVLERYLHQMNVPPCTQSHHNQQRGGVRRRRWRRR